MKKFISTFLALALILSILPFGTFELKANAVTSGDFGYSIYNGEAEITDYTGSALNPEIPSTLDGYKVTSIGEYAFERDNIESIIIPNSVTSISSSAFYDCDSLENITFPNSLTRIGEYAFAECNSLKNITIPNSVISIGEAAFESCDNISSITIPDSITSIGGSVFRYCYNLENVTIPNSVTSIGYSAFYECDSLENIVIPDSVKSIGEYAFAYCNSVRNITLPNSVTSIGGSAFDGCTSLENIIIPNSVTNIGAFAFCDCNSLESIVVPDSVISIGAYAFENCNSLMSVIIGNSVTSIGSSAFENCNSLTSVTIGNSVTSMGFSAFEECNSLETITIPDSIKSIGYGAFYSCDSLKNVYYRGSEEEKKKININDENISLINATWHYDICTIDSTHTYKTTTTKATLKKSGSKVKKCTVCGKVASKTSIYYPKTIKLSTTEYEYNGKTKKPSVKIYDSKGNKLDYGTDYTYKRPSSSKKVGKYSIKITFKGDYSGTKTLYYKIKPRDTKIKSVKPGSKKLTVKWSKKLTQSTGYEIQYSTSSTFKSKYTKTIKIKKDTTSSKTIKNLKAKKKYYVRVRCYYGNKTRYYSDWSSKKSKTTKK